jgi:copper resistance protein C
MICPMNRFLKPALVLVALALPAASWAHAMLIKAEPAVGAAVSQAPRQLTLHFSEGVEPAFTTINVVDAQGARMDDGAARRAEGDSKTIIVPLRPLPPGDYKVEWRATSVDTHKTSGKFSFTVAP